MSTILFLLIGIPMSCFAFTCALYAIELSALSGSYIPLGLAFLSFWTIFSFLRNLYRWEGAHQNMVWHDWIGGGLGILLALPAGILALLFLIPPRKSETLLDLAVPCLISFLSFASCYLILHLGVKSVIHLYRSQRP